MTNMPNDDIPAMIVPMILYRFKSSLETSMTFEVPEEDPTRAILVKVGRFQENPLDKNVSVSISGGDFTDPDHIDGRIDNDKLDDITIPYLPVGEIGGGIYWWRRGTIDFQTYFVRQNYPEDRALQYAYGFYGRLLKCVETIHVGDLVDDYGEKAYGSPYIEGASFFESGGKNKFIWRGKLLWRVLSWKP